MGEASLIYLAYLYFRQFIDIFTMRSMTKMVRDKLADQFARGNPPFNLLVWGLLRFTPIISHD